MKKWLLVPLLLLPVAAVSEPIDPNPNGIGIYADLDGRVNRVDLDEDEAMEVYVLVTRATGTGSGEGLLAGVEFSIVVPDNVTIWGWNMPISGSFAFPEIPHFMICFDHVPYAEVNHVLTLIIVPSDEEPAQFYLTALQEPSGGDAPRYMDSEEFALLDLTPYPGGEENMTFVINGDIVPEATTSWSDVKALYR